MREMRQRGKTLGIGQQGLGVTSGSCQLEKKVERGRPLWKVHELAALNVACSDCACSLGSFEGTAGKPGKSDKNQGSLTMATVSQAARRRIRSGAAAYGSRICHNSKAMWTSRRMLLEELSKT